MTSPESDPPNSKPEDSHADDWGEDWSDAESAPSESAPESTGEPPEKPSRPQTVLPPRRDLNPEGEDATQDRRPSTELEPKAVEKMPRKEVAFEELNKEVVSIEDKEWGETQEFKTSWIVVIGVVVIAMIIGCLVVVQQKRSGQAEKPSGRDGDAMGEVEKAINAQLKQLVERKDEARKLFADFSRAKVVEEILPMVRDADQWEGLIRQTGHESKTDREWMPSNGAKWSIHVVGRTPYAYLTGDLPDFSSFQAYFVMEDDLLLLDWKATTGYSTASFAELSKGEGDGSEVRGFIEPSSLYTAVWPENEYRCYQCGSPDGRDIIWCYVKRGTDVDKILAKLFEEGELVERQREDVPMTLKLVRPQEVKQGGLPNQWLIEELHHLDWIQVGAKSR